MTAKVALDASIARQKTNAFFSAANLELLTMANAKTVFVMRE